jgi:hypothetical protein
MGIVFGHTGVEEPAWRLVGKAVRGGYDVRSLPSSVSARVSAHVSANGNGGAFPILAGYIGVTSSAKNDRKQSIAMTAPVVQTPTSWDQQQGGLIVSTGYGTGHMTLEFLLPASFTAVEDCPKPNDERITLHVNPGKLVAVKSFSGWCSEAVVKRKLEELLAATQQDNLTPATEEGSSSTGATMRWQLAQYNPPFTIPQFRRNEIWLTLSADTTEAAVVEALAAVER